MKELNINEIELINGGANASLIAGGVVAIIGGAITCNPVGLGIGIYTGAVSIAAGIVD